MIDSHCHLAGEEFAEDLPAVVARARAAGVVRALVIIGAEDRTERMQAANVTAAWDDVRFSIGVHPHKAGQFEANPSEAAQTTRAAIDAEPMARAVGEIGLDYHYDFSPRDVQQAVFRQQLRLARELKLPVVIHTREAEDDTFQILRDEQASEIGGVFHCFTGDRDMATRALDAGFHVSLAGIVTFPRALELKEVARLVPIDRLLVETDSPYLAPVPHRGKRNEPAHVVRVAEVVAELRGTNVDAIDDATSKNFARLFVP
ncbi:MAG TPA: TatD family hydrolase [Vicinamibacterales bacterium]|jgi:TatD DNase family protein|nr:TatD family hydrolase [Vicinamibacterales bacterium]